MGVRTVSSDGLRPLHPEDPKLVGRYRLLARLGAGGMGRVYLGRSQGGRTVAVKVVHPHLAGNPEFRRRFALEVAAARRVGGFHTAQVVDADTDADPPWFVTEHIAGLSLQKAVADHGRLPELSVAALGAGLAEGLAAIHAHGLVHRDLKPGNVLLAADGPRIIDFGIVRALDSTSQTTRAGLIGTPGFIAPEQYRGRPVGPACDVFCLAAVLVFAATGRRPFGEGPGDALGYRVVNEDPDLTGVPASLLPLIAAGLAKEPGDRPAVEEFLRRCAAVADGEELPLPAPVTALIHTKVAETEALVGETRVVKPAVVKRTVVGSAPPAKTAWGNAAAVMGALLLAAAVLIFISYQQKHRTSGTDGPTTTSSAPSVVDHVLSTGGHLSAGIA